MERSCSKPHEFGVGCPKPPISSHAGSWVQRMGDFGQSHKGKINTCRAGILFHPFPTLFFFFEV